jgi:hypothetical protein
MKYLPLLLTLFSVACLAQQQSPPFSIESPTNGQVMLYENGLWVNGIVGAGSGTITDLTSTGSSIVVTNPTGPTTDVEVTPIAANSIAGNNNSTGTAAPFALNPLQAANLMSAVMSVTAACDATCSTTVPSGSLSIDGQTLQAGQTVLLSSAGVNGGIYVYSTTGTWTRAINFVGSIAANCDIAVVVRQGTVYAGATFYLVTTNAITIGSSSQSWLRSDVLATATRPGLAYTAGNISTGTLATTVTLRPTNSNDCASFGANTTVASGGQLVDAGGASNDYFGFCLISDQAGHPYFDGNGSNPTYAHTGTTFGAPGANNSDVRGIVTGNTAITVITINFAANWPYIPACGASTSVSGTVPYVTNAAVGTVTFTMPSLTGNFYYWCF